MKKFALILLAIFCGLFSVRAQSSCDDLNGYPQSKNVGAAGNFTLIAGQEQFAAQTYHYSGPGRILGLRVYGNTPNILTGVNLRGQIYEVDMNGRPTNLIGSTDFNWTYLDNQRGYKDVSFAGTGVTVSSNFAMGIELVGGFTSITRFRVGYNGDGEGKGEDLASISGTTTGFNWASAKLAFNKDGDFYILPLMKNYIESGFTVSASCTGTGTALSFTNTTTMPKDSMFNTIGLSGYSGAEKFYKWNFGDGSPVLNDANPSHAYASPGVYTVTLTATIDGWDNTCTDVYSMKISVGLSASIAATTNTSCYGSGNGSFVISASGGAAPYTYSLNGITYQASATFSNLAAGSYTAYVKDNEGCVKTTSATINQPSPIVFSSVTSTNASCGNTNGGLQILATGGSGNLEYSLNDVLWQPNGTFGNLGFGGYTVYVKDGNGCKTSTTAIVNDQGGPTLTVNSFGHVSCNKGNNGSINVSGSGGSGNLQYSINGTTFQASGIFSNLAAGTYHVIVKDANGCTDIKTVGINEPQALSMTMTQTPVSCYGGSNGQIAVTTTTGGTGNRTYSLNGVSYQTSNVFSSLAAGKYTVYVKDIAGCTVSDSITVTQATAINTNLSISNASCNSFYDGGIFATVSGGTPSYTFSLNGSAFYPTGDFNNLPAGNYSVIVRDINGCRDTAAATIIQPAAINAAITTGNSTCGNSNGNILAIASGGSGNGYTYSLDGNTWSGSGSFTSLVDSTYLVLIKDGSGCTKLFSATITDANGPVIQTVNKTNVSCSGGTDGTITISSVNGGSGTLMYRVDGSPWQTSASFSGLSAGTHTVVVSDGLGCTGSTDIIINAPSAIMVTANTSNVVCYGSNTGSITVNAGGGSGTLAYSINGTNYQSSNVFNNLLAGIYTVYVKDAGGCTGTTSVIISQPGNILIHELGVLNVTCHNAQNGSLSILATGGTGTLRYSLNGTSYQSSNIFQNLSGGIYTVYVKDASNCVRTAQATIIEPAPLSINSVVYNVKCAGGNDGVIDIEVYGGTNPYLYNWSVGTTMEDAFNLPAGDYDVSVTDINGCTKNANFTITQPSAPLVVNGSVTHASSATANDGEIDITVTGGNEPYIYSWSNGSTTEDISGLMPGTYTVTVTDENTCITSGTFVVGNATGIMDVAKNYSLEIFPNPAYNNLTVRVNGQVIKQLEVLNMLGERMFLASPGTENADLDVSSLAAGVYFVKLNVDGTLLSSKILIKR